MKERHLPRAVFLLLLAGCGADDQSAANEPSVQRESQSLEQTVSTTQRVNLGQAAPPESRPVGTAVRTMSASEAAAAHTAAPGRASSGYSTAKQAAEASLADLSDLVESPVPAKRGFGSAAEAKSAAITGGIPVYSVNLDQLVKYTPDQDAATLLIDKQEVFFPIMVQDELRSSVRVRKRPDGNWEAFQFAGGAPAKAIYDNVQRASSSAKTNPGNISLVEIRGLSALLVAHQEGGVLTVTVAKDVPGTSFTAGDSRSASEVLTEYAAFALKVNPGKLAP